MISVSITETVIVHVAVITIPSLFVFSPIIFAGTCVPEFSQLRVPDAHAISDLAMYNYKEVLLYLIQ